MPENTSVRTVISVSAASITCTALYRQRASSVDGTHPARQRNAISHAAVSANTNQDWVDKPSPSSNHSWNLSGDRDQRPRNQATATNTTSSLQYSTAGPNPGPQAARIQRDSGSCTCSDRLLAGVPRSTGEGRVRRPTSRLSSQAISNVCEPGTSDNGSSPFSGRTCCDRPSKVTAETRACGGNLTT